jgi:septal ring factor EnvC (AmiA/AmiB activator)
MLKILAYYRERVEAHEKDRFMYEAKIEKLRVKQTEAHKIEWELKKREEEASELEQALWTCQSALGKERGAIEEMVVGGEQLKAKQNTNKK